MIKSNKKGKLKRQEKKEPGSICTRPDETGQEKG